MWFFDITTSDKNRMGTGNIPGTVRYREEILVPEGIVARGVWFRPKDGLPLADFEKILEGGMFQVFLGDTNLFTVASKFVHKFMRLPEERLIREGERLALEVVLPFACDGCIFAVSGDVLCKCGRRAAVPPHTCPYKSEVNDDKTTLCTCCEDCRMECLGDT